jgi:hypothetical protein
VIIVNIGMFERLSSNHEGYESVKKVTDRECFPVMFRRAKSRARSGFSILSLGQIGASPGQKANLSRIFFLASACISCILNKLRRSRVGSPRAFISPKWERSFEVGMEFE